jgi:hypothetical protein
MTQKRNLFLIFIASVLIMACSLTRNHKADFYYKSQDFTYIQISDTISIKLIKFYKNDASCYTEAIPYALLIGKCNTNHSIPDTLSILAHCDNSIYNIGDTLRIIQIENPELRMSLHKITIVKDTIIAGLKTHWTIGSEYPGIWGKVIK